MYDRAIPGTVLKPRVENLNERFSVTRHYPES